MADSTEKILQDPKVIDEINRHKWFESERLGFDIGFEKAAEDWIKKFSKDWNKKNGSAPKAKAAAVKKSPARRSAKRV